MVLPQEVEQKVREKEKENYAFRRYLKWHAQPERLDGYFHELHKELFSDYDCSKCRNCCKMFVNEIPQEDIDRDAAFLGISREEFISRYLQSDENGYCYNTKHQLCDFLDADGECILKDCRPDSCKSFPHTDKPDRIGSLLSIVEFAGVCPVIFEMLERVKAMYHFRYRR